MGRAACAAGALALAAAAPVALAVDAAKVQEEIYTAANTGISVMLLGSVSFMMGLFYLVNQKDEDMRKYSWQVISATISIFSAVLLFQAVNGIVEATLLEGASEEVELLVSMVHMLVWFLLLQFLLAFISRAVGRSHPTHPSEEMLRETKLDLKCWAVLFGHITGFAAINAFGVLQQQVPRTTLTTFLIAPLAWLLVYLMGRVFDRVREKVALLDDGEEDEFEKMWDEETEETEDDVVGLAVSFTVVQSVRLLLTGVLPNPEGEEPEDLWHSDLQTIVLFGVGVAFAIGEALRIMYIKVHFGRITVQMRNIVAMGFAWCLFFSSDWFVSGHFRTLSGGMMKEVVLALFVTVVALAMIWLLDKVADMERTGKDVDKAVRGVVQALGILIGFSWEKSFDTAVTSISEQGQKATSMPDPVIKMVLAIVLAAVVIPAWRIHILPTILDYEELDEEKEEEKEEEEEEAPAGKEAAGPGELGSPLLARNKHGSMVGLDSVTLKKKVQEYKTKVQDLERRLGEKERGLVVATGVGAPAGPRLDDVMSENSDLKRRNLELEASIGGISKELGELQKLADMLTN